MLGFTQPTNYNIGMCEVQILPINNQYKVRNIKFQGQVTKNPVLDNCLEHFSPKQYKEYQNLISMANKVVDGKNLETYERMTIVQDKHRMVYKSYIGIRGFSVGRCRAKASKPVRANNTNERLNPSGFNNESSVMRTRIIRYSPPVDITFFRVNKIGLYFSIQEHFEGSKFRTIFLMMTMVSFAMVMTMCVVVSFPAASIFACFKCI